MPIKIEAWVDRTCLRPTEESRCSLAFEIEATGTPVEGTRAPARTVLALDVSLSMKGEPLDQVIRSVDRLVDALGPDDEIGIVAFSENATRVVDPVKVDAAGKRLVRSRVGRLFAESGTNIEAGLDLAAAMSMSPAPAMRPDMRRGVVLLSDGAPNVGAHTSAALREVVKKHRPSISFFSLGYGADHSEEVLSAIGDSGGGGYEYVQDPGTCARAFARALGAQGDVVASGIELVVTPAGGVELIRFVGREETRFSREGLLVSLPDMVHGSRRLVVAELKVRPPGSDRFVVEIVRALVRWREPTSSRSSSQTEIHSREVDATLEVADRESSIVVEAARRILLARANQARDESRALADRGQFSAAAVALRALMSEIERLPGWVVNDGTPLSEAFELLVDEAMAFERKPSAEQYAMFKKATISSKLGTLIPTQAKSRGDASQKMIEHLAGDCPEAWLLAISGGAAGKHMLQEECVIGRTVDADIRVVSNSVSRRHAEVFANAGDYWVCDLGSTNPTIVNGAALGRAAHKLRQGDVIRVGDVELRYEEIRKVIT